MQPIKEVTLEKIYNASPRTVWEALTNAEMLTQWWGPDNVTIPECTIDVKVGGTFYIVMEAGEEMGSYKGTLWPMQAEFTAVVLFSKLTYTAEAWTDGMKEETLIDQITDITLTEENGKTKVVVKASIYKTGPKAGMAAEGMKQGFTQQMEKLSTFLASRK